MKLVKVKIHLKKMTVPKTNTPKTGGKTNGNQSKKMKRDRSVEDSINDDRDVLAAQLQAEKKNTRKLMKQLETMQNQVEILTKSVNDMNQMNVNFMVIQSLQNEKKEILKLIPYKPSQGEIIHKRNKEDNNIHNKRAEEKTTKPNVEKEDEEDKNDEATTKTSTNKVNDVQQSDVFKKTSKIPPIDVWTSEAKIIQQRIIEALPNNCHIQ